MSLATTGIASESEYRAQQELGDMPLDLSYEEYVAIRKAQYEAAAAQRAAMNPLDREILENHEAARRQRRQSDPIAA